MKVTGKNSIKNTTIIGILDIGDMFYLPKEDSHLYMLINYENSAYDFSTECITLFDSATEVVIVPKSKITISVKG